MNLLLALCIAAITAAQPAPANNTLTPEERTAGFVQLFNGISLDGWTTGGAADAWAVENGEIVTRAGVEHAWWLRTIRRYRDFELRLDFKTGPQGNSGIGLRGSTTGDPAFTGMEVQILDSAGEPPSLTTCGAVYDAIAPTTQAAKPAGEWNTYRIRLVGDTLDAWLNGQPIHAAQTLDDRGYTHNPEAKNPLRDRLTTGYIALQHHGDPVHFRNIRVLDLSPDPDPGGFEPLTSGNDLAGWTPTGKANWTFEDGAIVGRDGPGHLFNDRVFSDFEVRAFVKVNANGNSGLYFRTVPRPENPDEWPLGFEAQVDQHDPKNFTGCIYNRAWPADTKAPITRDDAWFDYRVRAVGNRVQTWVNGRAMVDADLSEFQMGRLALQSHHPGNVVMWKDVQVRDLGPKRPAAAPAPARTGPVSVFYCTHSAGFKHDVLPETRTILTALGEKLDWLDVVVSEDIRDLTPERLAQTDIVMLYTTGALPMGPMRARLMEWVVSGGALVGVHSATDTLADDRDYVRTIGGTFDGHPWNEEVRIRVTDTSNPIVRPFLQATQAGRGAAIVQPTFTIADEIYQFKSLADDRRVLMMLDAGQPKMEAGRAYPLAWTREPGRGRVFYTALGHRPEVWRDQRFIDHLLAGIRWAARAESMTDRPQATGAKPEGTR